MMGMALLYEGFISEGIHQMGSEYMVTRDQIKDMLDFLQAILFTLGRLSLQTIVGRII